MLKHTDSNDKNAIKYQLVYNANLVNELLKELLNVPNLQQGEKLLLDAMTYSTLDSGKRLRSFLCIEGGRVFGIDEQSTALVAACIEMVHAYSLIHDDLPCLDNSDERRGKPSCHKKYDEATALLAGNALLTYAFEILSSDLLEFDSFVKVTLINHLSKALGFRGMLGGQMTDILIQNNLIEPKIGDLVHMQRLKTGKLFSFSASVGAILSQAGRDNRENLEKYGLELGFLYQIVDDILDYKQDSKNEDKNSFLHTVNKDIEIAKMKAQSIASQTKLHLEKTHNTERLKTFVDFVLDMVV